MNTTAPRRDRAPFDPLTTWEALRPPARLQGAPAADEGERAP